MLATEEHSSPDLLFTAEKAEAAGLGFAFVSDHFHPWNSHQGHSSNIWPLLGALAARTHKLGLVSAVTCPAFRLHPTTLAQSCCTVHHLSGGRFVLGLGTGEYLNEIVAGYGWPQFGERLARLEEMTSFLRELLSGREVVRRGDYFQVERATLYDAVPELPIFYAASGAKTAHSAGRWSDGLICLGARAELVECFEEGSRTRKPRLAQISVCWAGSLDEAVHTAHRVFPQVAMDGTLFSKLGTPWEFEEAAREVSPADVEVSIACGPDPEPFLREIRACQEAGFEAVALHQIGPEQEGFLGFWERELKPVLLK